MLADVSATLPPATGSRRGHPLVAAAIVGVVAGFLAGLFGVGGGILIVPGLVLVLHLDQRLAHGTSLAAMIPISMASLVTYALHGNVDWGVAAYLAVGAMAGAVLGTRLLHVVPERLLGFAFATVLVVTAVRLYLETSPGTPHGLDVGTITALLVTGSVAGLLAGLLGVGGGLVLVPALVVLFAIAPAVAKGTSVAVIVPTALIGTWRNRSRNNADLRVATVVGLGGVVSAVAGASVADVLSDDLSNGLFALLLLVVAIRMIWVLVRRPVREIATR